MPPPPTPPAPVEPAQPGGSRSPSSPPPDAEAAGSRSDRAAATPEVTPAAPPAETPAESNDEKTPGEKTPGVALHVLATVLAWGFPGLGHLLLGRRDRGLVLAATITSLYLAGLLIGGVAVIDRSEHPAWFVSQALIAPSFLVDRHHQNLRNATARGTDDSAAAYAPAFGRAQEQGTLYTAAAGLLNLLAILDAASRRPGHERRQEQRRQPGPAPPTRSPGKPPEDP